MKINRKKLLKLYNKKVSKIAEECDWKTHFTPAECVGLVCDCIESDPDLIGEGSSECDYKRISDFAQKKRLKLAYMIDEENNVYGKKDGLVYFFLGIINKKGEFDDYYYNSGVEHDIVVDLVPSGFEEMSESLYMFNTKINNEDPFEILYKCGYRNATK